MDIEVVNSVWPNSWDEAWAVLCRIGYENPKEYYVCFCQKKARCRKSGVKKMFCGKYVLRETRSRHPNSVEERANLSTI